ncbi:hypothetical protein [Streptomyces sp. NPDC047725]|uniref:hypothetical protein n=1 Tax=Streptomyces sp. NPDC047725 TaxID=3365487 RepID=UPI003716F4D7
MTTCVAAAVVSSRTIRRPSPRDGASREPEEQETRVKPFAPAGTSEVLATFTLVGPLPDPRAPFSGDRLGLVRARLVDQPPDLALGVG